MVRHHTRIKAILQSSKMNQDYGDLSTRFRMNTKLSLYYCDLIVSLFQGISFDVLLHEVRYLSEMEKTTYMNIFVE